jgi:Holliday junction resolvase RusA-like endonuclease
MTDSIQFVVYCKPEPQGSMKAFMRKGMKQPVVTSDNVNLKSFRQEVALAALQVSPLGLAFGKHVPVIMRVWFYLAKPESCPKKRALPVVKPDLDKLCRSVSDSLAGIIYHDDAQIVQIEAYKFYELPERVEIEIGKPEAVIG